MMEQGDPPKVALSAQDLEKHLDEQIGFIIRSCGDFDRGHRDEAKRLALSIRVLLHDTRSSRSLLGQLNRKEMRWVSTASVPREGNFFTHMGLVALRMETHGEASFEPKLDEWPPRLLTFDEWWNEIIFVDANQRTHTRRDLILVVADQDGGAHVDASVSAAYYALAKQNAMRWKTNNGNLSDVERVAVRQIAHEVIKTLNPNYVCPRPFDVDDSIYLADVAMEIVE